MKSIFKFFDKLEDRVRAYLSHAPLWYSFVGGVGVVLFWRGVWHTADELQLGAIASVIIGACILLITGVFVSAFIGNRLILSGLSGEKKLEEKTKEEIETEEDQIQKIQKIVVEIQEEIKKVESTLAK